MQPTAPGQVRDQIGLRLITAVAVSAIVIGTAVGIRVPAGLGWDFANFYDAGHRVLAGQVGDLYHPDRPVGGRAPQGRMRFWSAPLSAALVAPLSSFSPTTALVVFKLQNTIALFVALALLYRYGLRFVENDPRERAIYAATFAIACLIFQPFWTIFRVGGQTTPTVFLLLVVTMLCYTAARVHTAAWLLVVVAMIKPTFATMLIFLLCVGGWTFAVGIASGLAFFGLLSLATMGWPIHQEFLRVLVEGTGLSRSWLYNSSLYVPFENFRLRPDVQLATAHLFLVLEWATRATVVAALVVIVRRSRRSSWAAPAQRHFELTMAIAFWLLTSQLLWEHYLTVLFVTLAYLIAQRHAISRQAQWMVAAIFFLSLGQNLILVQLVSTHVPVESPAALLIAGLLKAGPLIVLFALLLRHHDEIFATYRTTAWDMLSPRQAIAGVRRL